MTFFNYVVKHYERLLIIPMILTIELTASIAGVAYSAVTSDVINSDNDITFSRIGGEIVIVSDNIRKSSPEVIFVGNNGETILSYDIISEVITSSIKLKLNVEGPYCIYFVENFLWQERIWINGYANEMSSQLIGYYTIIKPNPKLVPMSIENIVSGNKWIENDNITNIESNTVTHLPNNKVVFKIAFKN